MGEEPLGAQTEEEQSLRASLPLLAAGFAIFFFVIGGGIDSVSVYINALAGAEGWSRKVLSAAISVGAVSAALAIPLVGVLVDRFGVRLPMSIGCGLLAAGFGVLVAMTEPWHYVFANVLLGPGFAACALLPITVAVTIKVRHRTALALGIVGAGSSAGALVLAPAAQAMVDAVGWRGAYLFLGAVVVLPPIPCLLFALPRGRLRGDEPGEAARRKAAPLRLGQELRRSGVLLLLGIMAIPGLASFGLQVHLVPFLSDLNHSDAVAAVALGAVVGVSGAGKLGGGFLGDRLGALATLRLALALEVLALALLPRVGSFAVMVVFIAVHGLAFGTLITVIPVIALGILGEERFATLFGLLQLGAMLTIGLAPLVPGVIYDASGSYLGAVVFWVGAAFLALLLGLVLRMEPSAAAGAWNRHVS